LKKIITWLSIIILVAGAVGGWFWYQQRKTTSESTSDILRSAEIIRGDMIITVPASGSIISNRSSDLYFKMPGRVKDIFVQVGDQVQAGQQMANIESRDLQYAVEIAQIALEQAKLNLRSVDEKPDEQDIALAELSIQSASQSLAVAALNKELAAAQAELSNRMAREVRDDVREVYLEFQKVLEKYNLPYAYGAAINAADMEAEGNVGVTALKGNYNIQQAASSWWAANNALRNAEKSLSDLISDVDPDKIRQAELQIEQAQISVAQAQQRLDDAVITAPYDGTIAAVNMTAGLTAPVQGPGRLPAITIIDDNTLYAEVSIDEIDIGAIESGQITEITLDAYPDVKLYGLVEEIEEVPSNIGGIISYSVRISMDDNEGTQPRDGMTASVFIETQTVENILLVPNWAIRTDQTTTETFVYCYCMVDGTPQRTPIETGVRNDTYTEVLSGLEEGVSVVLIAEERSLFDFDGPPSFGN
jgi:HlyD family secretion protein